MQHRRPALHRDEGRADRPVAMPPEDPDPRHRDPFHHPEPCRADSPRGPDRLHAGKRRVAEDRELVDVATGQRANGGGKHGGRILQGVATRGQRLVERCLVPPDPEERALAPGAQPSFRRGDIARPGHAARRRNAAAAPGTAAQEKPARLHRLRRRPCGREQRLELHRFPFLSAASEAAVVGACCCGTDQ